MSENKFGFVFPGQGSQKIGMLEESATKYPAIKHTFSEASEAVGYDMWQLVQEGEQEQINLTETTQPVLLASSVALWRAWLESGGSRPSAMAGHSLGEFSALVCAGSIEFTDALKLVKQRGAYMQAAVPVGEGAMVAIIGLDDEVINQICAETASEFSACVAAVNFNSPGQVVIAGHAKAVEQAGARCKEAGAKRAMSLPVSAPFHTDLMKPAGDKLKETIAAIKIKQPDIPVIHNVNASAEIDPDKIKSLLVEQIYSPVQWVSCIEKIVKMGAEKLVECGPGKVLSGLSRRIDKSLTSFNIEAPEDLAEAVESLK